VAAAWWKVSTCRRRLRRRCPRCRVNSPLRHLRNRAMPCRKARPVLQKSRQRVPRHRLASNN